MTFSTWTLHILPLGNPLGNIKLTILISITLTTISVIMKAMNVLQMQRPLRFSGHSGLGN